MKEQILEKYFFIEQISYSGNLETLITECQQYLSLYEALCTQILGFNKAFLSNKIQIAESIYYTTPSDYENKINNIAYYRGNCSAFNLVIRNILERLQSQNIRNSASVKMRGLIRKCILNSLLLMNDYSNMKDKNILFPEISLTKNPDYSLYYDTCEQIIFGELQFDEPSDQSEVSPVLIRVMIELRLKWSMGISGYIVSKSPGNMSDFLEVYRTFINSNKISVHPRFDVVKRIYEWGNIYIHTGIRSYSWLTEFAVNLLAPLFYGEHHRASGIRVESLATIYEFWDALKNYYIKRLDNKELKIEIFAYQPGFICTDKNYRHIHFRNHYKIHEEIIANLCLSNSASAAYNMKCILQEGVETIGSSLYERVRNSYISLRENEIRERAYYLWKSRGMQLWDADRDWYVAIKEDIISLSKPI
ncbi:DUF2934 domain-containing protein [Nostoc sp. FACHB-87]|uniref:DUF2934 domain-containing protein n=1 Tax=Nostocaceae TaxID=1162 RepID=UPI001686EB8B|nr:MULTISPECIES: DUF2934 domain-containing protein [Nostocaceae]MBD2458177.1 DUF2934 domain-containing protein [Nostoc sp. FACHB-87]MBD2479392.1 DUF2934 domain-containing protein [Anabaena sp. FACHB-83]